MIPVVLQILHQDEHYVAINKRPGLLVHRTQLAAEADVFALQLLRDQLEHEVFPCHRLDRPTSGVLLFALNKDALIAAQNAFAAQQTEKTYLAITRGWTPESGNIDSPLRSEENPTKVQEAETHYRRLATSEIEQPVGRYATNRLSLIELSPKTGRKHQLRRHLAHIRHPILGDTRHGDGAQNKFLRNHCGTQRLLLHATQLKLLELEINAPMDPELNQILQALNLHKP